MLAKKRNGGDTSLIEGNLFHFSRFYDVAEAAPVQKKFQRGILQGSAAVARHDDVANARTKLKQGFEQDMVLMIMRNEDVIDFFRKVVIGITRNVAFVRVAHNRIEQ